MKRIVSVLFLLASVICADAQVAMKYTGSTGRRSEPSAYKIPTGFSDTYEAGSTLTMSGVVTGTPTSGTLNFSNLTLTLGTPVSLILTNATGLPVASGISGLGTGVATFLATPSSANLRAALTDETGTGIAYFVGGALGTPSSATLTSATGLPLTTGVTGTLPVANGGTGRATSTTAYGLIAAGTTATGAHQTLAAGATTEILVGGGASALPVWTTATGSGAPVRSTSPTLVTPALGTPTALVLTNATGLPIGGGGTGQTTAPLAFAALKQDATTSATGVVELATTAEALAGTSTTLVPSVAALDTRAEWGDLSRRVNDVLYSDGATSNRRAEWTPGSPGAIAGMPASFLAVFRCAATNPSATARLVRVSPSTSGGDNELVVSINTAGALSVVQEGTTAGSHRRTLSMSTFLSEYAGLWVAIAVVFETGDTSTSPKIYLNGVDRTASFTLTLAGTVNWMPTTLVTTKYCSFDTMTGPFIPPLFILGALSAAEVLEWTQTGRLPNWCDVGTGSAVASYTSSFASTVDGFFQQIADVNLVLTANVDGVLGVDDVLECLASGANKSFAIGRNTAGTCLIGYRYRLTFDYYAETGAFTGTPYLDIGASGNRFSTAGYPITEGSWQTGRQIEFTQLSEAALTRLFITAYSSSTGGGLALLQSGKKIYFKNIVLRICGPIAKPVIQPGVTLRDAGTNNLTGVLASGVSPVTMGDMGAFTGTLTWSATHEAKSLLGTQALPSNAVITRITRKATAGSSGSGCTIGTTTSATRWQALDTYTTAKEVSTLANQLPAGSAANDLDIVVDPDTANFTGSITVTVNYVVTDGAP
jgi:hypothetical protein